MKIAYYEVAYFFVRKLTTAESIKFVDRELRSWNASLTGRVLDFNDRRERWGAPNENREFRIEILIYNCRQKG